MSSTLYDIPVQDIAGNATSLAAFRGKVLLVVNVASKCGFTPQYEGLEALYRDKKAAGLEILGFPANDFHAQEPGTNDEIATFCKTTYDVDFPMFAKITVTGDKRHPLYDALVTACPKTEGRADTVAMLAKYDIQTTPVPEVAWNFEKFLVDRTGKVVGRFASTIAPDDPVLLQALDAALKS